MPELPTLKETVEKYELLAKKSLGQNFLLDMNITQKIVRESLAAQEREDFAGETVFEVGPGPGGLTRAVLQAHPQKLTVIEMDDRCIAIMREIKDVVGDCLEIVNGDALQYNFATDTVPVHIISNLPYNISVPLLIKWLRQMEHYKSLTLMFQKEVAERITAKPGSKSYGRISVLAQLICRVQLLFNLNPSCFVPPPKIWSSVLLFQPLERILSAEIIARVEKITEQAFSQRRKMIRQSLKLLPDLEKRCLRAGVALTDRAENITPEQYLLLAEE